MPTTDTTARDAEQLRAALVDYIRGRGTFQTTAVETIHFGFRCSTSRA